MRPPGREGGPGSASGAPLAKINAASEITYMVADLDDLAAHVDGTFVVLVRVAEDRYRRRCYLTARAAEDAARKATGPRPQCHRVLGRVEATAPDRRRHRTGSARGGVMIGPVPVRYRYRVTELAGERVLVIDIPDNAPADLKEGLARRQIVNDGGLCPCGARMVLPNRHARRVAARAGKPIAVEIEHERGCAALLPGYVRFTMPDLATEPKDSDDPRWSR